MLSSILPKGNDGVVKLLLKLEFLEIGEQEIGDAIRSASSNGHMAVVEALLDDIAKRKPTLSYITAVMNMGESNKESHFVANGCIA